MSFTHEMSPKSQPYCCMMLYADKHHDICQLLSPSRPCFQIYTKFVEERQLHLYIDAPVLHLCIKPAVMHGRVARLTQAENVTLLNLSRKVSMNFFSWFTMYISRACRPASGKKQTLQCSSQRHSADGFKKNHRVVGLFRVLDRF